MLKESLTKEEKNRNRRIKARNVINTLSPYRDKKTGGWYYDDEDLGVYKEAFVLGSSEVIDHLVGEKCNSFTMLISEKPIPMFDAHLVNIDKEKSRSGYRNSQFADVIDVEASGEGPLGWYRLEGTDMEHWLCGCVLDYFKDYPDHIYVKIQKK